VGHNGGNTPYIITSDWLEAGGGIVEQGSNADGDYFVFSGGICIQVGRKSVTIPANQVVDSNIGAYGISYVYGGALITYPKACTKVLGLFTIGDTACTWTNKQTTPGLTQSNIYACSSGPNTGLVDWILIGLV